MGYGKCFLGGNYGYVERHHIFSGALRQKSEKYGLVVELSPWMHREGPQAAHRCRETREALCKYGQRKAMIDQCWTLEEWLDEFGKNWLTDEELEEVEWAKGEFAQLLADREWAEESRIDSPEEIETAGRVTINGRGFRVTVEELPF